MARVHALVEGLTEETFVNQVLQPHLARRGTAVVPVVLTTKRLASGRKVKGGVSAWPKIEGEIRRLLGDSGAAAVTTMLDYYAFPNDAPGMRDRPAGDPRRRVAHVEAELADHFRDRRFVAHLSLHEFEAFVLSDPAGIAEASGDPRVAERLTEVVARSSGPESVDDDDPPSHRISREWPAYQKSVHGPLVTRHAGIPHLREHCPHFAEWLDRLERLPAM